MLNKELFGGGVGEYPYTHIIVPGYIEQDDTTYLCGYYTEVFPDSSLNPPHLYDIDNTPIVVLYNIVITQASDIAVEAHLLTGGYFLADYQRLYLARCDTKVNYGHPTYGDEESGSCKWSLIPVLFSPEDAGKEIPIWLSYDAPPWL